jgi:hypothetical protein
MHKVMVGSTPCGTVKLHFCTVVLQLTDRKLNDPNFCTKATGVAQCFEQRYKDLMIVASLVRIPLWDMGAGPSDETAQTEFKSHMAVGVVTIKNPRC